MSVDPALSDGSLGLADRTGVPDELAYLRGRFPPATWKAHPDYGALASFWQQVHGELRQEGAAVHRRLQALRNGSAAGDQSRTLFGAALQRHLGHLDLHHRVEDSVYFPRFRALDPRMVRGFDLLERDHEIIHRQLDSVVDGANHLFRTMSDPADLAMRAADDLAKRADLLLKLLDRHLDDEEDLVIPALLAHGERAVS